MHAVFKEPENIRNISENIPDIDHKWFVNHVKISRYSLQISKCMANHFCTTCKPIRSPIFKLLKGRFIPPPYALIRDEIGHMFVADHQNVPANAFMPKLLYRLAVRQKIENLRMDTFNNELNDEKLQ